MITDRNGNPYLGSQGPAGQAAHGGLGIGTALGGNIAQGLFSDAIDVSRHQEVALRHFEMQQASMQKQRYDDLVRGLNLGVENFRTTAYGIEPVKAFRVKHESFREELQHDVNDWLEPVRAVVV